VKRAPELFKKTFASKPGTDWALAGCWDGLHASIRKYRHKKGAMTTLSVKDARGKRLGRVYRKKRRASGHGLPPAELTPRK
jgi:hypothetical protein